MKRLTDTSIEDVRNNLDTFDIIDWEEEIFNKLAEYESTGLEPKEVEQLKLKLAVRDKALKLAVKDKIKYKNVLLEEFAGMGAKPALRKKEQYYLDQAEKELKGEK